ncbi:MULTISPECIES: hypothetical protein [Vibrio]|uniref:TadE-like protein n=1 Tax=Vibrio diazotrophicus TaxID=685 RepID=A0A2J8GWW5_VIBDI|nr:MULTISPECIES: hypothetical protein [Vibrio]MCF7364206.1 hypothetical protein [Vibrio sp. A1-b2]MCZ4374102.1 hypothetical protein [Vibrio diazotrophicus]PNH90495.1 hypothetical protein C1M59_16250 [Vibrio diazotrophicus]PNI02931.1 hypothetical protein C1N32_17385 [Vibrio diazotrophicus]
MKRYLYLNSKARRIRGSVSLEVTLILPMLLTIIVAASEVLTIFRVEQRLVNLNYNILEMVGNRRTLTLDNNVAQLPYFETFAETELSYIAQGTAHLSIAMHNAATNETTPIIVSPQCPLTHGWPDFELGNLVEVAICFTPDEKVSNNAVWKLWPTGRFHSHMIREIN